MGKQDSETEIEWYTATMRGIFPLDEFHLPKRVERHARAKGYTCKIDTAFNDVITGCAARESTWINDTVFNTFTALHDAGLAHSIEVWKENELCGGLYGIALGGAFFAESIFQSKPECMKIALGYCHRQMVECGFLLWDVQFYNDFLGQFGCTEITPKQYQIRLAEALAASPEPFQKLPGSDI